MKRNWKFFNGLMRKSKKVLHKEIIVYGISTNDTSEIGNYFCIYFIDHPRNIRESIPFSNFHHLDQIDFNDGSMFFSKCHAD